MLYDIFQSDLDIFLCVNIFDESDRVSYLERDLSWKEI